MAYMLSVCPIAIPLFPEGVKNFQTTKMSEMHLIPKPWEFQVIRVCYTSPSQLRADAPHWWEPSPWLSKGAASSLQARGRAVPLAWPGCFFPGHWLTFQPVPALLHLACQVAHCLEEADASPACWAPGGCPAFSPFTPFIWFFNFHDVALFVGWTKILSGEAMTKYQII